jgi:hypothetical protein
LTGDGRHEQTSPHATIRDTPRRTKESAMPNAQTRPSFEAASLSVLAYAQGFTLWHYRAQGVMLGTVAADGFLQEAADVLAPGDMVLVSAGDGGRVLYVTKQGQQVATAPLS